MDLTFKQFYILLSFVIFNSQFLPFFNNNILHGASIILPLARSCVLELFFFSEIALLSQEFGLNGIERAEFKSLLSHFVQITEELGVPYFLVMYSLLLAEFP